MENTLMKEATDFLNYKTKFMLLNIFVDDINDENLKSLYLNAAKTHNEKIMNDPDFYDSGFDLFLPKNQTSFNYKNVNKVDFKIKCCAQLIEKQNEVVLTSYSPFYTYARSSLSKTTLRLANNQGIIDSGYRGNLIGMFDCNQYAPVWTEPEYARLLQICAPGLLPIYVNIVNSLEELGPTTSRGEGGFGSTGK